MGKIIAIGGRRILMNFLSVDKEIIKLSNKKNPKLLFIPTASEDSENECNQILNIYGKKLKCKINFLKLIRNRLNYKEIEEKIMNSDIIYVGRGNTLRMMKLWRKLKIDIILKKAYNKGIVMAGVSAGAICWFRYGNSDSLSFGPKKSNNLIKVKGLDIIPILVCPHFDKEKNRRPSLIRMVRDGNHMALALEDETYLEWKDNRFRFLSCNKKSKAYFIYRRNREIIELELDKDKWFNSFEELKKL